MRVLMIFSAFFLMTFFNSCSENGRCDLRCYFEKLDASVPSEKKLVFKTSELDSAAKNISFIENEVESTLISTGSKTRFDYYITTKHGVFLPDSIRATAISIAYYYDLHNWRLNKKRLRMECDKIREYRSIQEFREFQNSANLGKDW
jgi:hypothetical protein